MGQRRRWLQLVLANVTIRSVPWYQEWVLPEYHLAQHHDQQSKAESWGTYGEPEQSYGGCDFRWREGQQPRSQQPGKQLQMRKHQERTGSWRNVACAALFQ